MQAKEDSTGCGTTHQDSFGFAKKDELKDYDNMKDVLKGELEQHFRPEFLNRLDEIVVFHKLTQKDLVRIVELETQKLIDRMAERGMTLELTAEAKEWLVEKGTDEKFGARPLRRAIEQYVEDHLSESILRREFDGKDRVVVSVKADDETADKKLFFEAFATDGGKAGAVDGGGEELADAT